MSDATWPKLHQPVRVFQQFNTLSMLTDQMTRPDTSLTLFCFDMEWNQSFQQGYYSQQPLSGDQWLISSNPAHPSQLIDTLRSEVSNVFDGQSTWHNLPSSSESSQRLVEWQKSQLALQSHQINDENCANYDSPALVEPVAPVPLYYRSRDKDAIDHFQSLFSPNGTTKSCLSLITRC